MSRIRPVLIYSVLAALMAGSSPASAAPGSAPPAPRRAPPTRLERQEILFPGDAGQGGKADASARGSMLAPSRVVDVEEYDLDIRVVPATKRVEGTVRIRARALAGGLASLAIDLYDQMVVSSVTRGPLSLAFTHSGNVVDVVLDHSYAGGELIDLVIAYGGTPPTTGYGSFTFATHATGPIVASLSEPDYAPTWWPCIERPDDKALVQMNLNVPGGLVGVSNGVLSATVAEPDGTKTYQWRSSEPISTYLVSVAISNYDTWTDWYLPVTGGPAMPVQHWVYPEHYAEARQDFSVTVPEITFFANLFGEYPFVAEKYGHAIFAFGGGMEHQTVTSYGASLIRGDNRYDWVVAHELAHQWWGDSVTLADWPEIWLNEGFATYSEALWWEHLNGPAGLSGYMTSLDSRPFCGTVYAPACGLFGHTVYDKGAWVLHMLRGIMGDDDFFRGLRDYAAAFHHGTATTNDFRAVMESVSGLALQEFFTRWLTQEGEPAYTWGWTAASTPGGWIPHIHVEQTQTSGLFVMPVRFRITTASGVFDAIVQSDQYVQDFALPPVPGPPVLVELDPDGWILKSATSMGLPDVDVDGVPDSSDNCLAAFNPAQADTDGDGLGDACDPDADGDGRDNGADCAPLDATAQDPPGETTGVDLAAGGPPTLVWQSLPGEGAGLTYDLVGVPVTAQGTGPAICLATGLAGPGAPADETISVGEGYYYLVQGRNVCGAGPLGAGSDGQPRTYQACP